MKLIICQQPNQSLKKKKQRNSPSKNSSEFSSFTRVRRETKFAVEMCAFVRLFPPSHVMPSQCRNFVLHSQTNPDYVHNVRTIFSLQKRKEHKTKNTQIVLKKQKNMTLSWPFACTVWAFRCSAQGQLFLKFFDLHVQVSHKTEG